MNDLEAAWNWYLATRNNLEMLVRIALKYWNRLPPESPIFRDDMFKNVEAEELQAKGELSLKALEDLAIVVLFFAFEATVRERLLDQIDQEKKPIRHHVLIAAAQSAREQVEQGSFFRVIQPYKPKASDLVEEVNQVRKYRNWVSHGKRGERPDNVEPPMAFDRLRRFLQFLDNLDS
ncbi:MAG: hypothetical protein U0800_12935 [Isosphaeraceae bacterium]